MCNVSWAKFKYLNWLVYSENWEQVVLFNKFLLGVIFCSNNSCSSRNSQSFFHLELSDFARWNPHSSWGNWSSRCFWWRGSNNYRLFCEISGVQATLRAAPVIASASEAFFGWTPLKGGKSGGSSRFLVVSILAQNVVGVGCISYHVSLSIKRHNPELHLQFADV